MRRSMIFLVLAALVLIPSLTQARVTRILIDSTTPISGQPYEMLRGRAFGELDPDHPLNAIITDIELAPRNANGKVEYVASFVIRKPTDMSTASGLLWHNVPQRGSGNPFPNNLYAVRDVQLITGWQGDNSGTTAIPANASCLPPYGGSCAAPTSTNFWVKVPVAKNTDGSSIPGLVMGRMMNINTYRRYSRPIYVLANPLPYKPVTLDTAQATLVTRVHETIEGVVSGETTIPSSDWRWANCTSPTDPSPNPFPGTPDPTQICVKGGFIANRVYQVVFTAKDPPVLGIGFAAFRDVGSFFKHETYDDLGTPNPLAGRINWVIGRGPSQSGNFLRAFLHLGFNQDEAGRQVQDGTWPIIGGRRVALNFRFATPDGVMNLYEPGSEGPQWWHTYPDYVRGLPPGGILDRCEATKTCPKIIEHFGAAEIWDLKLGPEWVGTDPHEDIPLPKNVRRYYISSTSHGGGSGGFDVIPKAPPLCPGTTTSGPTVGEGYGQGTFPDNPVPHTETITAIQFHFRNWIMNDTPPPPSRYPTMHGLEKYLVEPTKEAMGFPTIPGVPAWAPTGLINPILDYDFGPEFNYYDASGVQTIIPPIIKQVIPALVPRVDADGNELGGVPVVLLDAPLGTYLGWNITAAGVNKDKICSFAGGMIPFARTKDERLANNDPRLSLEERYGNHAGYVAAVQAAADNAVAQGFLLQADADALVVAAEASNVLNP